jgi:protein-tyrosine phosphatase
MIDWHSHILPRIDDGSKSIEESLDMLKLLNEQGIETVIATPHFYADENSVEEFLAKRVRSINNLAMHLFYDAPQILLGAEVCYYPGISNLSSLKKLCVEGTDILLLEMPVSKWTNTTVREISELVDSGEFTILLAHIERYLEYNSIGLFEDLHNNGVLMQINASFVNSSKTQKKAIKFLDSGLVRFLGSDSHNINSRKPKIGEAYDNVRRELGYEFISQMNDLGYFLLQ